MPHKTAIVIGAGIVGLAAARYLSEKGYAVTVFERNEKSVGASIRNFGMLWPIGQPEGMMYERALRSKSIWKEICDEAKLWYNESGSLHLCHNELEWQVINELSEAMKGTRPVAVLSKEKALKKSEAANPDGLLGALWSSDEMIVESRVAIEKIPVYLSEKYGVTFHFNTAITYVSYPKFFLEIIAGVPTWYAFAAAPILKPYTRRYLRRTILPNANYRCCAWKRNRKTGVSDLHCAVVCR